jgi:hypothetical protein
MGHDRDTYSDQLPNEWCDLCTSFEFNAFDVGFLDEANGVLESVLCGDVI